MRRGRAPRSSSSSAGTTGSATRRPHSTRGETLSAMPAASSANLVALTTLTSPLLGERRLQPGDEVITVAAGFPSTVSPIVQNGLVPVFVDVRLGDYNADPEQLRAAISPRTRAIMLAHTLGVPFDLDVVMDMVERHGL